MLVLLTEHGTQKIVYTEGQRCKFHLPLDTRQQVFQYYVRGELVLEENWNYDGRIYNAVLINEPLPDNLEVSTPKGEYESSNS